jgi:hypothetical protein
MPLTYDRLTFPIGLEALVAAFDAVERDAGRLVSGLDDATFNRAPAPGAWSAAQCLDHLTVAVTVYLEAMKAALPDARPPRTGGPPQIDPGFPSRWFIRQLEPPVRFRAKAPRIIVPAPARGREDAWRAFLAANDRYRDFVRAGSGLDLNRTRFKNPLAPGVRFTLGTGLVVMLAHHRRHVCQMERALAGPSPPPTAGPR